MRTGILVANVACKQQRLVGGFVFCCIGAGKLFALAQQHAASHRCARFDAELRIDFADFENDFFGIGQVDRRQRVLDIHGLDWRIA